MSCKSELDFLLIEKDKYIVRMLSFKDFVIILKLTEESSIVVEKCSYIKSILDAEPNAIQLLIPKFDLKIKSKLYSTHVSISPKNEMIYDVLEIIDTLRQIEKLHIVKEKMDIINNILNTVSPLEREYFNRIVMGKLRIGMGEGNISKIRQMVNSTVIGVHIKPILAKQLPEKIDFEYITESKYDGQRVQIHHLNSHTVYYSRTGKLLDIDLNIRSDTNFILDGELLIKDRSGKILSFNFIQNKKSLTDEHVMFANVFDIMKIDDTDLTELNLLERKQYLSDLRVTGNIEKVQYKTGVTDLNQELNTNLSQGNEGIVVKRIDEKYEVGKRIWYKLKETLLDTVDLCIIGGHYGEGKRKNTYGSFLLAYYSDNKFYPVCKVGSGFTDSDLEYYKQNLKPCEKYSYINQPSTQVPDVWFDGETVIEIKGDRYKDVNPNNKLGWSIRFPVYLRQRPDKTKFDTNPDV